ncbi:DUF6498-containing protein [Halorubrum sp. AD140]|uniref:DUF6498-containing protein n=1 Tax=Halorubrum sp. AD140 TaxID=3050073 RepID=UPI002ACD0056|nr:DUF6498-containing protein [Halorubrum sp. AD140]MDZ5811642.1 DUF6498-containing protein [Halorubrum sp. AD140]
MPSTDRLGRPLNSVGFAQILCANLLPLVGVLWLGWDPATLVVIYVLEILFSFPLAGVKALFAQRPPRTGQPDSGVISVSSDLIEKRESFELVPWLPPIYPRNLPFATSVVIAAMWFLIILGVVLSNVFTIGSILIRADVIGSALSLLIGQAVDTWRDYLRGGYETASPYTVIETPTRQAFFLAFVLFVTPGIGVAGVESVLGLVVAAKLLVEWSAYRATHDSGGRITRWLSGPETPDKHLNPVDVPGDGPAASIPTNRRAVLYTGVFGVLGRRAPFLVTPFIIAWFISMTLLGEESPSFLAIGISLSIVFLFAVLLASKVAIFYFKYGPLEYRRYKDRLVAYDTLLEEPQWSVSVDVLRDIQVVSDRLADHLLGSRTIAVTTGWDDEDSRRLLGPVSNPEQLVEAFELPVRTTALEPLDRPIASVVIACLFGIIATVVLLAFGPWIALSELISLILVYGIFAIPAVGLVLRLLWDQAYPDRSS